MKKLAYAALSLAFLAGCDRLDSLTTDMTSETWLASHPWVPVRLGSLDFVFAEPSSSLIVYGLGVALAVAGILFLKGRGADRSRLLWGVGLLAWSASTFLAGTSYQAFSYVLKFAGRAPALWTTWWEIWYLVLFTASMNLIAGAVAHSSATGGARKALIAWASANSVAYLGVALYGALAPDRFLASFECMLLFTGPTIVILASVNLPRWLKTRNAQDLRLFLSWAGLFVVTAAYFGYYLSGVSDVLWKAGIWFNANDVLHVGLIAWVAWLVLKVKPLVKDARGA